MGVTDVDLRSPLIKIKKFKLKKLNSFFLGFPHFLFVLTDFCSFFPFTQFFVWIFRIFERIWVIQSKQ
jgi:hypothetical protein